MKVSFQKNVPAENFIAFNEQCYPTREARKVIEFRYFNSLNKGDLIENNVIALDDDEKIIGQACYHPANYFFKGEYLPSHWGFDFFVDPQSRNEAVGMEVLDFVRSNKKVPIFGSGLGKKSIKIHKFFGYVLIGYLKKYYKIVNPIFLLSGFLQGRHIKSSRFPKLIGKGNNQFQKMAIGDLWDNQKPYNADLLEFGRDRNFLSWRFFSPQFEYAVYKKVASGIEQPVYFAARTTKIKRITCLLLADYRYNVDQKSDFESIIGAASSLASALFLPIVVTGSSHHLTDGMLEQAKFKITGEDRSIVSNVKDFKQYQEQITARNFVFTTLADTDGEYLM